jgi:hypothetical protein
MFRTSETRHALVSHPRLLAFDFSGALGGVSEEGSMVRRKKGGDSQALTDMTWDGGKVDVYASEDVEQHPYQVGDHLHHCTTLALLINHCTTLALLINRTTHRSTYLTLRIISSTPNASHSLPWMKRTSPRSACVSARTVMRASRRSPASAWNAERHWKP